MRKTLFLAATLMVATLGSAFAEDMQGVIQAVDPATRQMLFEDGTIFVVSEGVAMEELQPGLEIVVSFDESATGEKVVTQIQLPS